MEYINSIKEKFNVLEKSLLKNNKKYFKIQCLKEISIDKNNNQKNIYKSVFEIANEINNILINI